VAFPTNPVEGQIYKDKIFYIDRWIDKENYNYGDNSTVGIFHKLPYSSSNTKYYFQASLATARSTFDCSSMIPVGAKSILIKTMIHATPISTTLYGYVIVGFSDTNTFTGDYRTNCAQASLIGCANVAGSSYVGNGGAESIVQVDNNRKFYSYTSTYTGVVSANIYITVIGYYI